MSLTVSDPRDRPLFRDLPGSIQGDSGCTAPGCRGKLIDMITYIIVGLVAGAIAKALLPGRIGGGWLSTLVLGLVGAFVGGIIADVVFHTGAYSLLPRIGWATTGAVVVLAVKGWLSSRPSS